MPRNKSFPRAITLMALLLSWLCLSMGLPTSVQAQDPVIVSWYGDVQTFGQHGVPQRWVNLLGNVSDPDGVDSLYYTLNGGSKVMLTIGSDGKRLQSSGDFNVDLATNDLLDGVNEVIVAATDNLNNRTEDTVTVNYTSTNVWPLPYAIDWQAPSAVNEVSQAVDGNWEVTSEGIHTVTTGYDRLVAIGDTTWTDYEITVPVTIHSAGGGSGVGVLLRWMGHTDTPVTCAQPKCGYLPLGAICWYRGNRIEIYGNGGDILATQTRSLTLDTTYLFKARVETNPGVGGQYSFKVWKQSETEPAGWDITAQEALSDPQNGSLMLISHYGDVTYGNLTVTDIPISITNVQALVQSGDTSATISWNTSVPASSQVAYGLTPAHELDTVTDPTLKTSHSVGLTGLLQDTVYHYQISSVSGAGDTAFTGDLLFTTVASDIVSDDFNLPLLDTSLWTFVDPVGDCDYDLVGSNTADAWLNFLVPAGTEHQLWTSGLKVPHVRQSCNNTDFEVEAKFESPLILQFQEQGILVRQDDDTFMRFEFFSNATETHVYVASIVSGSVTTHADVVIGASGIAPLYMRVKRQSDQWAVSHSTDGASWSQSAIFNFVLTVTGIGPYAGNAAGGSSPAHTGSIDYFFNTASPVDPEDPVSGGVVTITSAPVTSAVIGQLYTYDVEATGTPAPTFSLLTSPAGMTIDGGSGLIEWTPNATGDFDVSVQASNTTPSVDIQDFVIYVADTAGGATSDDFNDSTLDASVWSFIDPLGGGGYTLTGTCTDDAWINISVPSGAPHEMWTDGIMAPHIAQPSGDTDFELEVKFESSLSGAFQEQGILVKQDSANFMRFEFFSDASNTTVFAAPLTAGPGPVFPLTSSIEINTAIGATGIAPLYMRVNRTGNQWTQSYSTDGTIWTTAGSFAHTLVVTAVGTYAGNAGASPAHTSSVDYFFNTVSPITPEDGSCTEVPMIVSTAVTAGAVGQLYSHDVDATGLPTPTYGLLTAPAGMIINVSSGLIEWTPAAVGSYPVSVTATNTEGADTQSFSIEVAELPLITSTPVLNGGVGRLYNYDVDATGTPTPTYALVTSPGGMAIDPVSGLITWTPAAAGDFDVSVQATNVAGSDQQDYSIHVDLLPDIPTLISPADLAVTTDNTPTFEWSSTAGAGGQYTLEYALDAAFTVGLVTVIGLTDTTYTVPASLADDTYYWHVESIDAGSLASGYQATPFSLTVATQPPAIPTLLTPADLSTINDNTPTMTWSATAGPGGNYTLEYGTDSTFGVTFTVAGITTESYTVIIPLADGPYFWHVKAEDQFGLESGYQAVPFKFTVDASLPTVPFLLTPPHLSFTSETQPTFMWIGVQPTLTEEERSGLSADATAAATYILQYSTDPTFTTATTTVSGLSDTTYTVPGGSPLTLDTWHWHVEAVDDAGNHSGYQVTPSQFGVFLAGDVNGGGSVTSADIIHLVNYVFKGGVDPIPCKAAGDINCDGSVTSADIIALVNYVFKGGPPPCNVGALIADGTWDCP